MKKLLIVLCFAAILALYGCINNSGSNTNDDLSTNTESSNSDIDSLQNTENNKITQTGKEKSQPELESNSHINQENDTQSPDATNVKAQVQVYDGCYRDEIIRSFEGVETDSPQVYYDIIVSNVTDTSFDFAVYEKINGRENGELVFPANTAVFIGDGKEAAYYGDEYTFYFTFPLLGSNSEAITIKISGFELLEEKSFLNNSIPGHESG